MNAPTQRPSKAHRIVTHVVRILMGIAFAVFGLNGFLNFIPQPPPEDFAPRAMLLANRFVALAMVLLAPFMVNSVAFHLFLEPNGLVFSLIFAAMMLYLAWRHRAAYRPLFVAKPISADQ